MSSNTSFVAQQLRGNTILEAYFVKTSDMLLEFQLKSNMNDTTILTNLVEQSFMIKTIFTLK